MRSSLCSRGYERRSGTSEKSFICVLVVSIDVRGYFFGRLQLRVFSEKVIDTKAAGHPVPQYASAAGRGGAAGSNVEIDVDSNASTPA